jgi:hypothetical protein
MLEGGAALKSPRASMPSTAVFEGTHPQRHHLRALLEIYTDEGIGTMITPAGTEEGAA